jgi:lipopolysaccharide export system permease protein
MSSVDVFAVIREKRSDLRERRREHELTVARMRSGLYSDYLAASGLIHAGPSPPRLEDLTGPLGSLQREADRTIRDRSLQIYWIEFHKKFSIPFACLAFTVFAFPVGLLTRRSGRSVGFAVGLMVAVIYWAMLIAGQTLGTQQLQYSAFLSMWAPNLLVLALGVAVFLLRRRA